MPRGRPKIPLLSREAIIQAALKLVDDEGLETLTTRRLAHDLGVKSASLYNHFESKDAIVMAVAEYVLPPRRTRFPDVAPSTMLVWGAEELRDALMAHPNLVSALVRQHSTGLGWPLLEGVAQHLVSEQGVRTETVMPLLESLERFVIGSVIRDTNASPDGVSELMLEMYPHLSRAMSARTGREEQFRVAVSGIINAFLGYVPVARPVELVDEERALDKERSETIS